MSSTKICANCKWSEYLNNFIGYECTRNFVPSVINGVLTGTRLSCSLERSKLGDCGIDGKFFEPKAWWKFW